MAQLPIINLGEVGLHNNNEVPRNELKRVAAELKEAFTRNGFLYFSNHGISRQKLMSALEAAERFFCLPSETKLKYQTDPKEMNHGYTGPNQEFLGKTAAQELRQSFNIHLLDGFFPDEEVPEMRPSVTSLANEFEKLSNRILKVLAIALELEDEDVLLKQHRHMFTRKNETVIRFLNYPPILEKSESGIEKLGDHADYGSFTLLFQDDSGGLEVKHANGNWIEAVPIPDTLLFNVAEMLELWSGGRFPATRHRVLLHGSSDIHNKKVRRSVACFVSAGPQVLVQPLDGSGFGKPVVFGEHMKKRYLETYIP